MRIMKKQISCEIISDINRETVIVGDFNYSDID